MKIYYEQLDIQIKKKLSPIYLISGEETLLIQEAVNKIRHAAANGGYQERHVFKIETGFSWEDFLLTANSFSLFHEKSLIELHIPDNKLNDSAKDALEIYCQKIPSDKILIIQIGKLDAKQQKNTWYELINQQGIIVTIWPIDHKRLPQWITQQMQQLGLSSDQEGIHILASRTEGNLLAAKQAIEKLSLLYGKRKISTEEIINTITDHAHFDVFNLVDAALLGDSYRIVRILQTLKAENIEPNIILWTLLRELRILIQLACARDEGQMLDQAMQQHKIWEKRQPLMKQALQRHSSQSLYACLQDAAEIDEMIKGAKNGNKEDAIMRLCLKM